MELGISSWMDGPFTVVQVQGQVSNSTAHALKTRLFDLIGYRRRRFILDLSAVDFADLTGFAALLLVALHLRDLSGTLRLVATNGPARDFIQRTGFSRFYPPFASVAAAKEAGVYQ